MISELFSPAIFDASIEDVGGLYRIIYDSLTTLNDIIAVFLLPIDGKIHIHLKPLNNQ